MATDAIVWGPGGEAIPHDEVAQRRRIAAAMLAKERGQPMGWSQGLAQGLDKVLAAMMYRDANAQGQANAAYSSGLMEKLTGGMGGNPAAAPGMPGPPPVAPPPPQASSPAWPGEETAGAVPGGTTDQNLAWGNQSAPPTAGGGDNYAKAIAAIESGGRYHLLGPQTKGDRAYGKYQVMGNNVPSWTEAALGKRMSPQEFLANPEAQEAVFKHRFGSYVNKYGPEGAAKAWFAGEGGMKNPNARDVLGTSVSSYAQKFMKGLGQQGGAPVQVASLGGVTPDSNPAATPGMPAEAVEQQAALSQAQPSWQEASALPNFAPPQRQAPPPVSPAVQRVAQALPQIDPRMAIQVMRDPRVSPGEKQVVQFLLQQQMQQQENANKRTTIDLGDRIIERTADGRVVATHPKGEPKKAPTWGVINKDPITGTETYGYPPAPGSQPAQQSAAPPQMPSQQQQPLSQPGMAAQSAGVPQNGLNIPPPPPGAHVPTWTKKATEDAASEAFKGARRNENAKQAGDIVVTDIDRTIKEMDGSLLPTTGLIGQGLSYVGGTAAHNVSKLVDTVKANTGFRELQKMRDASPTGGALGSITERELTMLQSTLGSLEQSQTDEQFRYNLKRVKNVYLDLVHGKDGGPPRETLESGKAEDGWKNMPGGVRIRMKP